MLTSLGSLTPYWTILHQATYRLRVRRGEFDKLTTFHFTDKEYDDLEWERKGEEFELDGKMYDIASVEKTETGYTVKCKHDEAETLVKKLLNSKKDKRKSSSSKKRPNLKYTSKYIDGQEAFSALILTKLQRQFLGLEPFYKNIFQDIESPPPELV